MKEEFYHINDELLVKYLLNEATPEERMQVEVWIGEDDAHRKYYSHLELLWNKSKQLEAASTVDENLAWQRFRNRAEGGKQKPGTVFKLGWLRVAALFVLIIGAALLAYLSFPEKPVQTLTALSRNVPIVDTLPDGSIITLNKNSALRYPEKFKDTVRAVALEGEAFFNVTPNKNQPFVIQVYDLQIKVVGTSFNVKSSNGNTEVIVETGMVQVIKGESRIALSKGEKILVQQRDSVLQKMEVEDKLYNYYRSKEFVCEETPLWKLVQVLNEAYNANIVIENSKIRSLLLTTTFHNEPLDNILSIVSATFSITVEKKEDKIVLK